MTSINGHINQALTNYALETAKNLRSYLIADIVSPVVRVANQSDSYYIYDTAALRIDAAYFSGNSQVNRIARTWSDSSYTCKEFALEAPIPWALMRNADQAVAIETRDTADLVNKLLLRREKAVADVLFANGTFTNTAALAGQNRWDTDTSEPVKKVSDAKEAIRALVGVEPNAIVVGAKVWAALRNHPDICQRVAGLVAGTPASESQAAAALGVDRIIIGRAIYNSAAEGAAAVLANVWGNSASVCYIDPAAPTQGVITPMQTFEWAGVAEPFSTFTYEDNTTRAHVVQAYDCCDTKAIAVNSAYLYTTVVS